MYKLLNTLQILKSEVKTITVTNTLRIWTDSQIKILKWFIYSEGIYIYNRNLGNLVMEEKSVDCGEEMVSIFVSVSYRYVSE